MFSSAKTNPFDDIVAKTTDENLTSENWELIINLCDKVDDEGEQGARNVIAALLKRLAHRNSNVQIYALALADSLSKNCKGQTGLNREISSKSFTQGLERLVTDRNTHDKVKKKALSLIAMWAREFNDESNLMTELYNNLKAKNYRFEEESEPPPPRVDDDILRKEEEELLAVLEMSKLDKGGRGQWDSFNGRGAGGAGSSSSSAGPSQHSAKPAEPAYTTPKPSYTQYAGGYVPARTPSPKVESPVIAAPARAQTFTAAPAPAATQVYHPASSQAVHSSQSSLSLKTASRVRALYPFEGSEKGELSFQKGDIIKVVDQNYTEWWRGQLKGRTGIFPVNYVELLPDPTSEDIAKEAEQEAVVFAQAANVDKLLSMLRGMDPAKDNLADNEEIQELYNISMSLRPRVVKLIDKYSQKRTELVTIHETFVKARNIYDRMMEESLARNSGMYDARPTFQTSLQPQLRPDSRIRPDYGASPYPMYDQQPAAPFNGAFPQPAPPNYPTGASATPQPFSQPAHGPQQYPGQQVYALPPQGAPEQAMYGGYPQQQQQSGMQVPQQQHQPAASPQQVQQPAQQPQQMQIQTQVAPTPQPQNPVPQIQQTLSPQLLAQAQQQQAQAQAQAQAQNAYHEPTGAPQPQPQGQPQPTVITGNPPYPFDPLAKYPDENAQAWAAYYAQGGEDPQGLVYFISVPRLKEAPSEAPAQQAQPTLQARSSSFDAGGGAAAAPQPSEHPAAGVQPLQINPQAQQQPVGQMHPSADALPGYNATMQNGSTTSLQQHSTAPGPGNVSPQSLQHQRGPSLSQAPGSPTFASQQQQPPYYAAQGAPPQTGPTSPIGGSHQQLPAPGQYPPNPYPDQAPAAGAPDPNAQYNAQFAQMHGQFGAMGVGERTPSAPATQTV
ncbi:hypothetical protein SCHPADRAFT_899227 [Schizopora paradoxa]|uniref:Class E vacuolar protein-sorting machinery protein HSE1 n=1 Tax=Schizopora paradoxa TaxID=27342 RepID=A0A0H2S4E8_9AGAM|nr:hypothetical protein SCHPADRAFT_899227 [Schizopora paradoxa]